MSPNTNDDILAGVLEEVDKMSDEEIAAETAKIMDRKAKNLASRKNKDLTPEQLAKRTEYRKKRYARDKAIVAKAKEMGLVE